MQTCSLHMIAPSVTQTMLANHPSLTVSTARDDVHAGTPATMLSIDQPKLSMLQAATHIQPVCVSLSRQLHHACRPGSVHLRQTSCRCPSLTASQATPLPTVVTAAADDARKAASGNASSVKAAFAEAGLSQDAIDHILAQYPHYLGWDVEQKLLPAMQHWQQELDDQFVSEFARFPFLLHTKPEEEQIKDQYLASIGIRSPELIRKRNPSVMRQSLTLLQSRVAFLQQYGFTPAQVTSLIKQNPDILLRTSEYIEELLRGISDMFGCAQDTSALSDVLLSCRDRRFFTVSPAALRRNFTYMHLYQSG